MKAAIKYIFIWLIVTVVVFVMVFTIGFIILGVADVNNVDDAVKNPWLMAVALICSNLVLLLLFWNRKYTRNWVKYGFTYGEEFSTGKLCLWTVVGAVGCLMLEVLAQEYLPLPTDPEIGEWLGMLMLNPVGILGVCLIGPLAEEAIFRGAILRRLLEKKWNPWIAIVISAIIFAIAHGNFEQGLTAIIMGCFMGWIYYRTRSIMPCFLVHAFNNTTATVIALTMSESMTDMSSDKMGVPLTLGLPLIVVSLVLIYVAARYIGKMTDNRTPVPVPVNEVLPPPLPYEATQGYVSPQGPESNVPVEGIAMGIPVEDPVTEEPAVEPGELMQPES